MSYAAAAHHAPASTDPTPDHSLLVSQDDSTPNPDAKHVKIASTQQDQDQSTTIPQKRGNETSSSTSAVPGLNGANPGGATSSGGKKKKNKKNKKDTATTPTTPPNTEEASPQETEKKSSKPVKEESSKIEEKKEQAQVEKKEQVQTEEKKEPVKVKTNEEVEKKETKKVDSELKTSHDEDNGEDEKKEEQEEKEEPAGKGFDTELESMSSTQERPTVSKDLDQKLADPYVPRANIAATVEHPNGTTENDYAKVHKDESVLQQHVAFFDRDSDGIIWPLDTFVGFHNLGYSLIWCVMAVFLIHPAFSYFTLSSWIPDPFFRVKVKTIHRARHGSDTGVYDSQGRFVSAKFEEIFTKFDKNKKGGLTFFEGLSMLRENRNVADPIGWIGAFFEWFASYLLIWPKDGIVTKEDLRTIYDGSIFFAVAEKESTIRAKEHRFYSGLFKENRGSDIKRFNKKIQ